MLQVGATPQGPRPRWWRESWGGVERTVRGRVDSENRVKSLYCISVLLREVCEILDEERIKEENLRRDSV